MPFPSLIFLLRRISARVHLLRGRRRFAVGRLADAAHHAQRAMALAGPSFAAHLLLGKVYLRQSRFDRARFELSQARFLDPGRFAAEGLSEDVLLELARRFHPPLFGGAEQDPARVAREDSRSADGIVDDFTTTAERERFRRLPPIRRDEIDGVDWDSTRDLFDD